MSRISDMNKCTDGKIHEEKLNFIPKFRGQIS